MIEISEHKLNELIEGKVVQELENGFSDALGMKAYVVDESGKNIAAGARQSDLFRKVLKASGAVPGNSYGSSLYSAAGVYIISAPVTLNGKAIGYFVAGGVLCDNPSSASGERFASDIGMSVSSYLEQVSSLKVMSEGELRNFIPLVGAVAGLIASKAQSEHIKRLNSDDSGIGDATSLVAKLSEAKGLVAANSETLEKLRSEFTVLEQAATKSVSEISSSRDDVKQIQNVAKNTRILGFNAYIEAARAKEYGKSFGVITQEIRDLADKSKEAADKIEDSMTSINGFSKQIDTQVKNTEGLLDEAINNGRKFGSIINSIISQSETE